jgi:hypothetical protein
MTIRQVQHLKLELYALTNEIEKLGLKLATWVPMERNVAPYDKFDRVALSALKHKRLVPELVLWAKMRTRQAEVSKELAERRIQRSLQFNPETAVSNGSTHSLKNNRGVRLQSGPPRPLGHVL